MAGTAKTSNFMLGSATLMLGSLSELWDLLPASHSLGLVKNIQVTADPSFVDLTQGTKNTVVYSMLTSNPVKISAEVFEYTAKNLTYGLSLDGSGISTQTVGSTTTSAITGDVTPTLVVPVADASGFSAGNTILIGDGTDDNVLVRKIASIASNNITVDTTIKAAFPSGSVVKKANLIDIGSQVDGPFLSAKIAGKLANGQMVALVFPKVRITKGFTMAFNSSDYGNLPYEIEVMDLLPTDSFYSSFTNNKGKLVLQ